MKLRLLLLAVCTLAFATPQSSADDSIQFSRDILPLLSENCFQCHGPDEANREAGLRLDQHAAALAKLDSGETAIVPGQSSDSVLFTRINNTDDDLLMPPPDSGKKLSAAEITRIRQWIDDGAAWGKHWSFQTPSKPALPDPIKDWAVNNPIDLFIQTRLARAGWSPEHASR